MKKSLLLMSLRVANLAAKFALVLFITKYLGLEDVGRYALVQTLSGFLPALFSLGLSFYLAREAVTIPLEQATRNLWQQWQVATLLYLFTAGAAVMAAPPWMLFAVGIAWLTQLNDEGMQLLINKERPIIASAMQFLRDAGWAIAYMAAAFLTPALRSMEMILWFWLVGQGLGIAWYLLATRAWPWWAALTLVDGAFLRQTLPLSWKFWVFKVADAGSASVDKWLITALLGLEMTGIYALFSRVGQSLRALVISGVFPLHRAKLIAAYAAGRLSEHKTLTGRVVRESALFSGGIIAVTIPLFWYGLPYLGRPELAAYFWLLLLTLGAYFLRLLADCLTNSIYTARKDNQFTYSFMVVFVLGLTLNASLIPMMGLLGAVISYYLSGISLGIYSLVTLRRMWLAR